MRYFLLFFFFLTPFLHGQNVDIVVFSFNRPLQLYAFLESLENYGHGIGQISVLYRSSDQKYELGYQIVKKDFPSISYIRQNPKTISSDFKPLLMEILKKNCPHGYIAFAVDDLVCKDFIDFDFCTKVLEQERAEAFHLRMGENLDYCYSMNQFQPLPAFQHITSEVRKWIFDKGVADWKYPHTVDMAIFRKHEVVADFSKISFSNPNTLEGSWTSTCNYQKSGLCFTESKVVNFPLNLVNEVIANRHANAFSPEWLLETFLNGQKMDLKPLHQIKNRSAHMDYRPIFKERGSDRFLQN